MLWVSDFTYVATWQVERPKRLGSEHKLSRHRARVSCPPIIVLQICHFQPLQWQSANDSYWANRDGASQPGRIACRLCALPV